MAPTANNDNLMQRVFTLIEYMSEQRRKLSIHEISEDLGIAGATVHRLLNGLKALGYVKQCSSKHYYLTYKLFEVAGRIMERDQFADDMMPFMNYFSMKYNCDVGLSVFNEDTVLNLMTVGTNRNFRSALLTPGSVQPPYCTAAGKVFLAQLDDVALDAWLERTRLVPYTSQTTIDPDVLKEQVIATRLRGYGLVVGEYLETIGCVSVPILERDGRMIGAMNFSLNIERIEELNNEQFLSEVKGVLKDISK